MNTDNGSLSFDIKLELDHLRKDVEQAKEQLRSIGRAAKNEGNNMDNALLKVGKTMGTVFAASQIKAFLTQVVSLRSEIQRLEISFETLAGKSKGDALFSEIRQFAVQTPMMMRDLAQGAQTMLAFNIEAEKVMPMLKALGDISMGDAQKFNSLTLAFSQMSATGRLMGQDLLQMINAGFNPLAQISEKTGKSIGTLKEEMEAGQISVEMVTQAFMDATAEGGKFHGMLEAQAEGIAGAQAKLAGAIDDMMNEIGQSMEGTVVSLYDAATKLAQNYQQVGRVLAGLIATYGIYRAALIAVTAAKEWATVAEAAHYKWLLLVEKAQKLLNATMLNNPYVLVATLIAGVVAAMVSMKTETEKLRDKEREYEEQKQKVIEAEQKHREEIDKLCNVAGDEAVATDTRREALYQLEKKYPDIFAKYKTELEWLQDLKKIKQEIAIIEGKNSITNTSNELSNVNKRIAELEAKKKTKHTEWDDPYSLKPKKVEKGGLSADEERELKVLYGKKKSLSAKKRKEDADAYFTNLTGISDEELERRITLRKNLIAKIDTSSGSKTHGRIGLEGETLNGTYSRAELQAQLQMLEREKTSRASAKTPADFAKEDKKAYDDAIKAYNDFLKKKDRMTPEEFAKQSKALKDARDAAKKKYESSKPYEDSDVRSATNKADQERKRANRKKAEAAERERAIEEAKQAEIKANRDAALEVRQEELNLQADSTEKRLAQIEIDKERMANAIEDREADLLNRYRAMKKQEWGNANPNAKEEGKVFDYKSITLSTMRSDASKEGMEWLSDALKAIEESKRIMVETAKKATDDVYDGERKTMNEYLRQWGNVMQQRNAIIATADQRMKEAATQGERLSIAAEMKKELADFDFTVIENSFAEYWQNAESLSVKSIDAIIAEMEQIRDKTEEINDVEVHPFDNFSPEQIQKFTDALARLKAAKQAASKGIFSPIKDQFQTDEAKQRTLLQKKINELEVVHNHLLEDKERKAKDVNRQLKEILDKIKELKGEDFNVTREDLDNPEKVDKIMEGLTAEQSDGMQNMINDVQQANGEVTQLGQAADQTGGQLGQMQGMMQGMGGGGGAGGFMQTLEMVGKVVHLVNQSVQDAAKLVHDLAETQESFGKDTSVGSSWDKATTIMDGFSEASEGATHAFDSLKSGNPIGLIQGIVQSFTGWIKAFNKVKDAKHEREIIRIQKQIERLQEDYERLGRSVDRAFSKDASRLIAQQNQMLKQQKAMIEAQLAEEKAKKNSDQDKIDEYEKTLRSLNDQIEDNERAMVDAIFGEDVKTAINNFADAYASMFDEGFSKARASKNLVRDMIRKMIMEAMKADLSAPMEKIRELLNDYFTNEVIEDWEEKAVEKYVEGVLEEQAAKWGWADKYLKEANGQEGTRGGFTTMSQDTADELNGRFTAIQMDSAHNRETLDALNATLAAASLSVAQVRENTAELRDLSLLAIDHLENISKNTHELYQMNERLGKIEKYTSRL